MLITHSHTCRKAGTVLEPTWVMVLFFFFFYGLKNDISFSTTTTTKKKESKFKELSFREHLCDSFQWCRGRDRTTLQYGSHKWRSPSSTLELKGICGPSSLSVPLGRLQNQHTARRHHDTTRFPYLFRTLPWSPPAKMKMLRSELV